MTRTDNVVRNLFFFACLFLCMSLNFVFTSQFRNVYMIAIMVDFYVRISAVSLGNKKLI